MIEKEIHPGIYQFKLFDRPQCRDFCALIERMKREYNVSEAPNSMNKYGTPLLPRIAALYPWGLWSETLAGWLRNLVAGWCQGIAERHYPEIKRLKVVPYAFVVDYERGLLKHYDDGSAVTLNACLGHKFEGGTLRFYDAWGKFDFEYQHRVGYALVHRGTHVHKAEPLKSGSRTNLILWCSARSR